MLAFAFLSVSMDSCACASQCLYGPLCLCFSVFVWSLALVYCFLVFAWTCACMDSCASGRSLQCACAFVS